MFSKLYDIFTKKSKSAKDKIAKKIEDATSDEAMDSSAINHPIKLANTFRGLAMGATAILAFATWHISVPFALAAAASSFIINEYGIESNNKKRQTLLKRIKETKDNSINKAIKEEVNIPVKFIGLGERMEDLKPFDIESYIYGLFKDMM